MLAFVRKQTASSCVTPHRLLVRHPEPRETHETLVPATATPEKEIQITVDLGRLESLGKK